MRKNLFLFLLLPTLSATPVYAQRGGDMFDSYAPTSIPIDRPTANDLFPTSQPFMRPSKDMFDSIRPPGDFGIEDLFSAHVNSIPDSALYHWPEGEPSR